jgi:hypothetical protein
MNRNLPEMMNPNLQETKKITLGECWWARNKQIKAQRKQKQSTDVAHIFTTGEIAESKRLDQKIDGTKVISSILGDI